MSVLDGNKTSTEESHPTFSKPLVFSSLPFRSGVTAQLGNKRSDCQKRRVY